VNGDAGIWQRTISQAIFHTLYQTWFQLSTCKLLPANFDVFCVHTYYYYCIVLATYSHTYTSGAVISATTHCLNKWVISLEASVHFQSCKTF
jgi:hypothetical protein